MSDHLLVIGERVGCTPLHVRRSFVVPSAVAALAKQFVVGYQKHPDDLGDDVTASDLTDHVTPFKRCGGDIAKQDGYCRVFHVLKLCTPHNSPLRTVERFPFQSNHGILMHRGKRRP